MFNFGAIEVLEQQGLTKFPQGSASAWAAFDGSMTGASYKPVAYVGNQQVKGVNHIFIAEQTLILEKPERHIVAVKINEFEGNYTVLAIERIF